MTVSLLVILLGGFPPLQASFQRTYCNPINLDYAYCPIPDFTRQGKHRTAADPTVVVFRGDYYLFATNQWGYWWSNDMLRWRFVPRRFLMPHHKVYDELCAPAAFAMDDSLFVIGSTYTKDFPLWKSSTPRFDQWTKAVDEFKGGAWDPAFFLDDDRRLYLYHGSSNLFPLYGREVDRKTLQPIGDRRELLRLQVDRYGWERFGEANDNTFLRPFLEGAWMTKHRGRYYLQYSAPGTEFSGYADGAAVGDRPLGPFTRQTHNPFCYKPGGFARGAGHGSTYQDPSGRWWHASTIVVGVKNNFERRIGIWPAGFDRDGVLFCDTAYGDYPHHLPATRTSDEPGASFAGWMLLNYAKPVRASSSLAGHPPNMAVDEDLQTYWSAVTGRADEWFETDIGAVSAIRAVQVNFADQGAEVMGKRAGLFHQYRLLASVDGVRWTVLVDKGASRTDAPHDYVELQSPAEARFVRLENVHMPSGTFALSGLRVFGRGKGKPPKPVHEFVALRGASERRNAWLKWQAADDATGYVLYAGVDAAKLYTSIMVYAENEYYFRAMDRDRPYYFQIEAFNENGISARSPIAKVE